MSINAPNGVLTWRPAIAQSPGYYPVTAKVADNGSPSLSDTNSFNITVDSPANPVVYLLNFGNSRFSFTVTGDTGPDYSVLVPSNLATWAAVWTTNSPQLPFNYSGAATNFNQRFYRVLLGP